MIDVRKTIKRDYPKILKIILKKMKKALENIPIKYHDTVMHIAKKHAEFKCKSIKQAKIDGASLGIGIFNFIYMAWFLFSLLEQTTSSTETFWIYVSSIMIGIVGIIFFYLAFRKSK